MRDPDTYEPHATVRDAALLEYTVSELRRLASLTGGGLPTRKMDLVERIVDHLAGDGLRAVWEQLDETQRMAVAEVVHAEDNRFHEDGFFAKYGTSPAWDVLDPYPRRGKPEPIHFFFYGDAGMPDDLKVGLRAFVPPPAPTLFETVDDLPSTYARPYPDAEDDRVPVHVRESERAAQRELHAVLRLIDAGEVGVGPKTHLPSVKGLGAVTSVLEGGDYYPLVKEGKRSGSDLTPGPIRAFAWPVLLRVARLAEARGSRLQLTKAGRAALSSCPADTIRTIWRRWRDTTFFDELSRVDVVKGQKGRGKRGLTPVKRRRAAIGEALAAAPTSRWFEVEAPRRYLLASGSDYQVAHDAWGLYIEEQRYGSLGYDGGEVLLDTRYLWCVLFEYAATLGLVDVAFVAPEGARHDLYGHWGTDEFPYFSRYDGLLHARLTSLGAYCLGRADQYTPTEPEAAPVLNVLPNYEIAAVSGDLYHADRLALDAYATKVSDRVWRLDARRLLETVESGRTIAEIREFLIARTVNPIPDTVSRLLDDAEARSTALQPAGSAFLVKCRDADLASLIAHDAQAGRHCLLAGDRHLAVPYPSQAAFGRALRKLGFTIGEGGLGAEGKHR